MKELVDTEIFEDTVEAEDEADPQVKFPEQFDRT